MVDFKILVAKFKLFHSIFPHTMKPPLMNNIRTALTLRDASFSHVFKDLKGRVTGMER